MVGYWCRVGSRALTHTHNDVAILVQRRTLLSIFFVIPPTARCTKVRWLCFIRELPGLVAAPPGVQAGSSPLIRSRLRALCTTGLFVANVCLSCLALGCSHTITLMASGLYPKPCPGFGSMPKPCSCYLSNHLGEKQLTSVSSCSVSTIGVVVVDVSGDSTAMCSVNFDLRTRFFRVGFAATCPAAAWLSGLDVSP